MKAKFYLMLIMNIIAALMFLAYPLMAAATNENFTIVTYYPSPSGNYDRIDVFNQTVVQGDMVLDSQAYLSRMDAAGNEAIILDNDGFKFSQEKFTFENDYFTPSIRPRTLRAANGMFYPLIWDRNIGNAFGILQSVLGMFTFGYDTSSSLTSINPASYLPSGATLNCQDAFVNNVYMFISAAPSCFAGPPSIPLAICWGTTREMGYYTCLNPRSID